jgi:hypothetical protein
MNDKKLNFPTIEDEMHISHNYYNDILQKKGVFTLGEAQLGMYEKGNAAWFNTFSNFYNKSYLATSFKQNFPERLVELQHTCSHFAIRAPHTIYGELNVSSFQYLTFIHSNLGDSKISKQLIQQLLYLADKDLSAGYRKDPSYYNIDNVSLIDLDNYKFKYNARLGLDNPENLKALNFISQTIYFNLAVSNEMGAKLFQLRERELDSLQTFLFKDDFQFQIKNYIKFGGSKFSLDSEKDIPKKNMELIKMTCAKINALEAGETIHL